MIVERNLLVLTRKVNQSTQQPDTELTIND
jgi:hypothetical protein